jgi:hypothetical protein
MSKKRITYQVNSGDGNERGGADAVESMWRSSSIRRYGKESRNVLPILTGLQVQTSILQFVRDIWEISTLS